MAENERAPTPVAGTRIDVYLVRHCAADGYEATAGLTAAGREQAEHLASVLAELAPARVLSSPFERARLSIEPLVRRLGLPLELDARLQEHDLGDTGSIPWADAWRACFEDVDKTFPGGESTRSAADRVTAVVDEVVRQGTGDVVLVTHGKLLTLLLGRFDGRIGLSEWAGLTNPDVFRIRFEDRGSSVLRVWLPG